MKHDHPPNWAFQLVGAPAALLGFLAIGPLLFSWWGPGNWGTLAAVTVAAMVALALTWAAGESLLQLGNRRRRRCPTCTPSMRGWTP